MLQACRGLILGSIVLGLIGCDEEECKKEGDALAKLLNCDTGNCCAAINPLRSDLSEFSGKCFEFANFPEVANAEVKKGVADLKCEATCVAEAVELLGLAQCDSNDPQTCCNAVVAAEEKKNLHEDKCNFYTNKIVYRDELKKLNDAFTAAVSSCEALNQAEGLCKETGTNLSSELACSTSQCCEVYNPLRSDVSEFLSSCENYTSLFEVGNATEDATTANTACQTFCVSDLQDIVDNLDLECDDKAPSSCCDARDKADVAFPQNELSCSFYSTVPAYSTLLETYGESYNFADQTCPTLMMI